MQVTVQILILLLSQTSTATTGGLESVFNQKTFGMEPETVLVLSITWSILSCVRTHTKIVSLDKGCCGITSKIVIFIWGSFATLRRVLSLIILFVPSMGLFSILHFWRTEQVPFKVRKEYAKRFTIRPDDKIALYGLNETLFWNKLDRWDYSNPENPTPPPYSEYTLLSLKDTFLAALILFFIQFLLILTVKILTSADFKKSGHYTKKAIHVLENLNYATPYKDWDDVGDYSIGEFRVRYKSTYKEMGATFAVNILCTTLMMLPLVFTGEKFFIKAFVIQVFFSS